MRWLRQGVTPSCFGGHLCRSRPLLRCVHQVGCGRLGEPAPEWGSPPARRRWCACSAGGRPRAAGGGEPATSIGGHSRASVGRPVQARRRVCQRRPGASHAAPPRAAAGGGPAGRWTGGGPVDRQAGVQQAAASSARRGVRSGCPVRDVAILTKLSHLPGMGNDYAAGFSSAGDSVGAKEPHHKCWTTAAFLHQCRCHRARRRSAAVAACSRMCPMHIFGVLFIFIFADCVGASDAIGAALVALSFLRPTSGPSSQEGSQSAPDDAVHDVEAAFLDDDAQHEAGAACLTRHRYGWQT